jgi:rhamnosyltransferase
MDQLHSQIHRIVIVDNNSSPVARERVETYCSRMKDINLIQNSKNLGVARAFNQGLEWAYQNGYEFGILFDQDSTIDDHFYQTIQAAYESFPAKDRLAVLASLHRDYFTAPDHDGVFQTPRKTQLWKHAVRVISSGSVIPLAAWMTLGKFREELFIDHVDDEYTLRAWKNEYKVIQTTVPILSHSVGNTARRRFLWRDVYPMNQTPFRWYYVARNLFYLVRKYGAGNLAWVYSTCPDVLWRFVKMSLCEDNRWEKIVMAMKGMRDSFRLK